MIKSVYSESNGYAGYFNYMKYWAKNGAVNWICNTEEYAGSLEGYNFCVEDDSKDNHTDKESSEVFGVTHKVNYTYLVTNFWNNYDGTKSPLDGNPCKDKDGNTCIANGFPEKKSA